MRLFDTLFIATLLAPAVASQVARPRTSPSFPATDAGTSFEPGIIIGLQPFADPEPIAQLTGSRVVHGKPEVGLWLLRPPPGTSPEEVVFLALLTKGVPTVYYAEPDQESQPPETPGCGPSTEEAGAQQCTISFMDATPTAEEYDNQPAAGIIAADAAHAMFTPTASMVVAVIDTGLDLSHPGLVGSVLTGNDWDWVDNDDEAQDYPTGTDKDGDGLVDEGLGHGTHISGLVLLADPNAMILPLRVLDADGNGSSFNVALSIYYAVDEGAHVINMSLSMRTPSDAVAHALMYAEHYGVTVVTSAGNTYDYVLFPDTYHPAEHPYPSWAPPGLTFTGENVIGVASTDDYDIKAVFSSYGPDVEISAPGVGIYSLQWGNNWAWWEGTSMSAGLVSGCCSYLLSIQGSGYTGTLLQAISDSAVDLDVLNPTYAGDLGAGRIDLYEAALIVTGP
ncbi:MAG: S8 family serine peptidase [Planctomycetota bacterium]|nr:S8 family serine peptidase [Planctomycetota bacterium]